MWFSVYVVWPSVLSFKNLNLHKIKAVKNVFVQEKIILRLSFNPGLVLPAFEQPGPGARFSKAPETFRARKAIFSPSVSRNGEVDTPETSCMKGTSGDIKNT